MLELKNITKIFNAGTVNEKKALDNFSLDIKDGEFVTVIGANGSGKTTMLNIIAGVYTPDSGRILIDGTDVTNLPEHKRAAYIGRVFQDPMLGTAADMWVEENLAIADRRGKCRNLRWFITKKDRERYKSALAELGLDLENRLTAKMRLLSGGQRQAVTLLMASIRKPKLLLLDEHTAALDPKAATKVLDITDRIVEESGLTTLMITHSMKDAIIHGNRLIMLASGHSILDVSGEEKKKLTVETLVEAFAEEEGRALADNAALTV